VGGKQWLEAFQLLYPFKEKNSVHPIWDERCLRSIRGATQLRLRKPASLFSSTTTSGVCSSSITGAIRLSYFRGFRFAARKSIRRCHLGRAFTVFACSLYRRSTPTYSRHSLS